MTESAAAATPGESGTGVVPPTPITEWLQDVGPSMDGFVQSMTVRTPAGMTGDQLETMVDAVLRTHDMLRARADGVDGHPAGHGDAAHAGTHDGTHAGTHDGTHGGARDGRAGRWTLAITKRLLDGIVLLDEPTILAGMRFAVERLKQVVEPAGAAALGAVLAGRIPIRDGERVVVRVSGGNVEVSRLGELLAGAGTLPGETPRT